jgi:putative ABC transport system ATP-binding protein
VPPAASPRSAHRPRGRLQRIARTGAIAEPDPFRGGDCASLPAPAGSLPGGHAPVTLGTVLSLRALTKSYAGPRSRTVFRDVNLELGAGDYVAVMGESGVGKSTLLNLAAGLDRVDTGSVTLDGIDMTSLDDDALTVLRRRAMGFVFQAFHILPYLSVAQNVALPLSLLGVSGNAADARVADMLASVGLADRGAAMPRELSGGELQRIAIARALVHRPQLVLIDEPTGNLDPDTAQQVLALLHDRIKEHAAAGILVTHSRSAAGTADRILVLTRDGLRNASLDP